LAARNLAFAERTFAIQRPIELTARVDRVYDDGHVLKLLELKTRTTTKVYLSDVFELSAQRLAVRSNTGREVSDQGYVLLLHPVTRRETLHRVDLLPESSVLGEFGPWTCA
jgi:CRISPR-associated exonuclease Cas4